MKRIQGNQIVGYIGFSVTGKRIENFLQLCTQHYIPIWDVEISHEEKITCKAYLKDSSKINKICEQLKVDLEIHTKRGVFPYISKAFKQKTIILSLILSIFVLIFLSNVVWKVTFSGVSTNLEQNLQHQLQKHGLFEGGFIYSLDSLDVIQNKVLHDIPELLYLGIEKKGTTYHVSVVEKLIEKDENQLTPQDLIAAKSGMVEKIYIRQGVPLVKVNEHITKGDILVSGKHPTLLSDTEEAAEREEIAADGIAADGEVYAQVWYEVNAETPLYTHEERLDGEKTDKYTLGIAQLQLPMLFFNKSVYTEEFIEMESKPIYFIKWKTPLKLIHKKIYNKEVLEGPKNIDKARDTAIQFALNDLLLKTGSHSEIDTYYILHEVVDNGKIKLKLYISVIENIVESKPYK